MIGQADTQLKEIAGLKRAAKLCTNLDLCACFCLSTNFYHKNKKTTPKKRQKIKQKKKSIFWQFCCRFWTLTLFSSFLYLSISLPRSFFLFLLLNFCCFFSRNFVSSKCFVALFRFIEWIYIRTLSMFCCCWCGCYRKLWF